MKLMKGDEISLRHLGTSWEGKGHVVKVPDSILFPFLHLLLSYCTTSIQSVFFVGFANVPLSCIQVTNSVCMKHASVALC